jgi:hypothetical protein
MNEQGARRIDTARIGRRTRYLTIDLNAACVLILESTPAKPLQQPRLYSEKYHELLKYYYLRPIEDLPRPKTSCSHFCSGLSGTSKEISNPNFSLICETTSSMGMNNATYVECSASATIPCKIPTSSDALTPRSTSSSINRTTAEPESPEFANISQVPSSAVLLRIV